MESSRPAGQRGAVPSAGRRGKLRLEGVDLRAERGNPTPVEGPADGGPVFLTDIGDK
jgi:hypothetical protein